MLELILITRIFAIILFAVALFKISRLLSKLKQFGYVSSTCMLRTHIFVASLDLICSIIFALLGILYTLESIKKTPKQDEDYTVDPENFALSLIIQRTYDFSNQLVMLIIVHLVNK